MAVFGFSGPEGNRTPYSSMPWKRVTGIPRAPRLNTRLISDLCPREESDPQLSLRTGLLYPFNYEGIVYLGPN